MLVLPTADVSPTPRALPCRARLLAVAGFLAVVVCAGRASWAQAPAYGPLSQTGPENVARRLPPVDSAPPQLPAPTAVMPVEQPAGSLHYPMHRPDPLAEGWHPILCSAGVADWYRLDAVVRGYFLDDQRLQWSGMENTFGAEAALMPVYRRCLDVCEMTVLGEFYLNQPFDRNRLADTAERRSYAANFEADTLEISQLLVALRRGDLELTLGKMETPFGRTYFPLFSNARLDAPFMRTEAIRWRETGLMLRYDPGWLVCDVALSNGVEDRDTNSSKALVSRIGFKAERWAGGVSVKLQDGSGSEGQKEFNNQVGADLMCRWGFLTLSGEVIGDQYGFRRPGFNPEEITWPRSIYYRDIYKGVREPINGVGYYVNLGFEQDRWGGTLNYGEYYPESIGDPRHDVTNRRGIVKLDYDVTRGLEAYAVVIVENGGQIAQADRPRRGNVLLTGIQYTF